LLLQFAIATETDAKNTTPIAKSTFPYFHRFDSLNHYMDSCLSTLKTTAKNLRLLLLPTKIAPKCGFSQ